MLPDQPPAQVPRRIIFYVLRFTHYIPLVVFIVALLLRLGLINAAGFWRDEVASLTVAGWSWADIVGGRFGEVRNQPPVHTLLIRLGLTVNEALGGGLPAEAAARMPFALAGALTCALLAAWGGRRFGVAAGGAGGLLLATSYGHLFQSDEARPYALLTLATLAALVALDQALDGGPHAARWWAVVVAAGLAGVASSYLMVYAVLPGLGLWAAARLWPLVRAAIRTPGSNTSRPSGAEPQVQAAARRQLRAPIVAAAALALGTLSALPELLRVQWASDRAGNNPADATVKLLLYNGLSFGPAPGAGWAAALVGLTIIGAVMAWRTGGTARTALIGMATVAGAGLGALALAGSSELVAPRYWSSSDPFLCLLAGVGLVRLGERVQARRPGGGSWPAAALAVLAFSGTPSVILALAGGDSPPGQSARPDYRTAARLLATLAQPDDGIGILSQPEHAWRVCDWYWRSAATSLHKGVQVRDFADPRLSDSPAPRRIYWLIAADDPLLAAAVAAAPPPGLTVVGQADRLVILRENGGAAQSFAARFATLATALQAQLANAGLARSLAVAQADALAAGGDWAGAAAWDRQAGRYRALGGEHLASAAGFLARHEPDRALIEIAAARALEPGNPAIYSAAAPLLDQAGDPQAAAAARHLATALAQLLANPTPNPTSTH